MAEEERPQAEAILERTDALDLATLVTAAASMGCSINFSVHISPPDGTAARGEVDLSSLASVRGLAGSADFAGEGPRPQRARYLFHLEQRVRVPHLGIEGIVAAITNWADHDPEYVVRWNDNKLRERHAWFKADEIEPIDNE